MCVRFKYISRFFDPDFLSTILSGLTKLKFLLRKKLAPATILDGIELICGTGCGREWSEQILRTGWADPVHPKQHIYSKMALNLIERVAAANNTPTSQKRTRSECLRTPPPRGEDRKDSEGGAATKAAIRPTCLTQPPQPTRLPEAADQLGASTTTTTTRGRPQGAEAHIPAGGMQEVEAMLESEAAATSTGEDSLKEAGGGLGAAGRDTQTRYHLKSQSLFQENQESDFLQCNPARRLCRLCIY
jgi:hypothetical protein